MAFFLGHTPSSLKEQMREELDAVLSEASSETTLQLPDAKRRKTADPEKRKEILDQIAAKVKRKPKPPAAGLRATGHRADAVYDSKGEERIQAMRQPLAVRTEEKEGLSAAQQLEKNHQDALQDARSGAWLFQLGEVLTLLRRRVQQQTKTTSDLDASFAMPFAMSTPLTLKSESVTHRAANARDIFCRHIDPSDGRSLALHMLQLAPGLLSKRMIFFCIQCDDVTWPLARNRYEAQSRAAWDFQCESQLRISDGPFGGAQVLVRVMRREASIGPAKRVVGASDSTMDVFVSDQHQWFVMVPMSGTPNNMLRLLEAEWEMARTA